MKRSSWKSLIIFLAFGLAVIGGRIIGLSLIERIFVATVLGALVELSFYFTREKK
jgi:energy-converting hydrogenase Eha subunit A